MNAPQVKILSTREIRHPATTDPTLRVEMVQVTECEGRKFEVYFWYMCGITRSLHHVDCVELFN